MIKITKNCKFNRQELTIGKKVELEHTNSKKVAERIAKQHLCEFPNYYSSLNKMERELAKQKKLTKS